MKKKTVSWGPSSPIQSHTTRSSPHTADTSDSPVPRPHSYVASSVDLPRGSRNRSRAPWPTQTAQTRPAWRKRTASASAGWPQTYRQTNGPPLATSPPRCVLIPTIHPTGVAAPHSHSNPFSLPSRSSALLPLPSRFSKNLSSVSGEFQLLFLCVRDS